MRGIALVGSLTIAALIGPGPVPPAVLAGEPRLSKSDLFEANTGGYAHYRIPGLVVTPKGTLLAYCGHTLKNESPRLIFPSGFDPAGVIFGAHRVDEGPLFLVKEPLDLLVAFEHGVTNLVCFLAEVTPQSLEMLASLMDQRKCLTLEFYVS